MKTFFFEANKNKDNAIIAYNIQVTISASLQYFTWQIEATSDVNFIWKFGMWIQA